MVIGLDMRLKKLREAKGWTQAELGKKMGITRASVNAWEMGISNPSTDYLVELAKIFQVSSDYLLGLKETSHINVEGLSVSDVGMVYGLIDRLKACDAK